MNEYGVKQGIRRNTTTTANSSAGPSSGIKKTFSVGTKDASKNDVVSSYGIGAPSSSNFARPAPTTKSSITRASAPMPIKNTSGNTDSDNIFSLVEEDSPSKQEQTKKTSSKGFSNEVESEQNDVTGITISAGQNTQVDPVQEQTPFEFSLNEEELIGAEDENIISEIPKSTEIEEDKVVENDQVEQENEIKPDEYLSTELNGINYILIHYKLYLNVFCESMYQI